MGRLIWFKYKKILHLMLVIQVTARLIIAALMNSNIPLKLWGWFFKKRDMFRIIEPLSKFGLLFKKIKVITILTKRIKIFKTYKIFEKLGSAQCKSAVMIAALFVWKNILKMFAFKKSYRNII